MAKLAATLTLNLALSTRAIPSMPHITWRGVLGEAPHEPGLDEAIVRWLGSVPDPVALVPIPPDGAYRGLVALRAFAVEHIGRRGEACLLLLNVQASSPHLLFAERIVGWIET